ncbi:MAG: 2-amino-4-hydroxy-6-hydroxymethyldihydropteridine diphosphokinase [Planctomycetota bacterium]
MTDGIYIGLGSNLGSRAEHIYSALRELAQDDTMCVKRCSRLHETTPVGGPPDQPLYLNAVAELSSELSPHDLLAHMQAIEAQHGRVRAVRNGARTLDLDLLLYGQRVIDDADLVVPHPRMWERPFVMQPLAEICPPERLAILQNLRPPTP